MNLCWERSDSVALNGVFPTEKRRAVSVCPELLGEVRSHDSPQLPEELEGDLHVGYWLPCGFMQTDGCKFRIHES